MSNAKTNRLSEQITLDMIKDRFKETSFAKKVPKEESSDEEYVEGMDEEGSENNEENEKNKNDENNDKSEQGDGDN